MTLPRTIPTASNRFRSVNDPSLSELSKNPIKYRLRDTPGHGKLREPQGLSTLRAMLLSKTDSKHAAVSNGDKLRGVIFMVDTAALTEEDILRDTAAYLHDVLMVLQKRALKQSAKGTASQASMDIPLLVAANKQDLFTALPPGSVREKLELEIDRIRKSRSKGLLDASADLADGNGDGEDEILGGDSGGDKFTFKLVQDEVGVRVDVIGGAVKGDADGQLGSGVMRWEEWIGMRL